MRIFAWIPVFYFCSSVALADDVGSAHVLAKAQHAIRAENWIEAEQQLTGPVPMSWEGHYAALQGMIHLQNDRAVDAVQSLQSSLASPTIRPPLRNQAQFHLGRALLKIEDPDGAWETLLDLLESDELAARAELPKPDDVDPGQVRWLLAQVALAQGRDEAAQRQWESLWALNPTSAYSDQAEEELADAGLKILPNKQRGIDLITSRIRSLEKLYRYREALSLRQQLPTDHRLREPHRFAAAVFKAKDYARATNLLGALSNRSADEDILLALAQVRSGDPESSMRTYRYIAKGSGSTAELAKYKLGYMHWDQGQWSDAIQSFADYLIAYPTGKHADSALWFTAMAQMRFGANAQARNTLERLQSEHPRSSLKIGAAYWLAKLHPNPASRQEQLAAVVSQWPATGYAWFASQALGISYPTKPTPTSVLNNDLFQDPDWRLGVELSEAGLETWARPHLESLIPQAKQSGRSHRIALATALIKAGSYQSAKRLAQPWCTRPENASDPVLISVCWPQPSQTTVSPMAQEAQLSGHLPFAIMTAESALDPGVTSPAGARGLMQLMPNLAQEIHAAQNMGSQFDPDFLFRASTNATLGTIELTRLARYFEDTEITPRLPLIIAGYNGGREAVDRWVGTWKTLPTADAWSEFIGYSETRKYVRRVLGYLQTYRLAYGDSQPTQTSASSTDGSNANASPEQP
uniref:Soluble lytic murein transglycosylase and related regulatory proteins (Some contain lysm/invasin domains) n=1 Tax=uncultured delta proteobacterium HF0070_10I02 TaxID=710824 RepID=E0XS23_9DELT|nr:soluble lytic murein transglycosylase and related regulatory proteins (some contain lysm/invasin domains) [uncultured delta proteobacterium HF0070_10I02]